MKTAMDTSMIPVGIDKISFYTSRYYLNLKDLAEARGVDPNKFYQGLGQELMSVLPPDEDIVTLAATACVNALNDIDRSSISMVLMATESGIDQSKSAGIWVHNLLNLPKTCRVIELKQACYSATFAVQMVLPYLRQNPDKKVLVLASDEARYGLGTPGEPTQGCAACAIVLSANPRLMTLENEQGYYTSHVMDFWRPNYRDEAIVDGKYSTKIYLTALGESWKEYQNTSKRNFFDHERFCYHIPFTRMAEKAHERLVKLCGIEDLSQDTFQKHLSDSLIYSKQLGNSYTAALYIGIASMLENTDEDLSGKRIAMFSYGSGCSAEFFSGIVQKGYQRVLNKEAHSHMLKSRKPLSVKEYEDFYTYQLPEDGSAFDLPKHDTGSFRLVSIGAHQRIYEKM